MIQKYIFPVNNMVVLCYDSKHMCHVMKKTCDHQPISLKHIVSLIYTIYCEDHGGTFDEGQA